MVKKGDVLFVIEPAPYEAKVQQAEAERGGREGDRRIMPRRNFSGSTRSARRPNSAGNPSFTKRKGTATRSGPICRRRRLRWNLAKIELGYTKVTAPFDGIVTTHLAAVGALVGGGSSPTPLATILRLDPIYVTANLSEQDVLRIIADPSGISTADLGKIPIELGLMNETGYPHKGVIDYIAPQVDPSTGTLRLRGMFANPDYALLPGLFAHVRVPPSQGPEQEALLVPETALGSDQAGPLCAGRRQGQCRRQAQRDGRPRRRRSAGHREGAGARRPGHRGRPVAGRAGPEGQTRDRRERGVVEAGGRRAMISQFFIDRPVLANVLAILLVLIGAVALARLPVAEYPDVAPPTIMVTTRYPGGSAQTLVDTVALPIERAVNGVEGMLYMQSTSTSDGNYSLTVTFETGTDLNLAQIRVQNRVSGALPTLPQSVQSQGVPVRQQSTAFLQMVTLSSPDGRYDGLYLSNYATINLVDELSRVPGVGHASVFGAGKYAMRIWLDPDKLVALGSSPQEVIQAVQQQNQEVAAGQIGMPPAPTGQGFQYTVNVSGRLQQPEEFGEIVIKTDNGRITRLKDVARVELGAESYGHGLPPGRQVRRPESKSSSLPKPMPWQPRTGSTPRWTNWRAHFRRG